YRFLEDGQSVPAACDHPRRTERGAERAGSTPDAGKFDLVRREPAGFVRLAELPQRKCRRRAPADERRIAAADLLELAAGVEELGDAACRVSPQDAKARARVAEEER